MSKGVVRALGQWRVLHAYCGSVGADAVVTASVLAAPRTSASAPRISRTPFSGERRARFWRRAGRGRLWADTCLRARARDSRSGRRRRRECLCPGSAVRAPRHLSPGLPLLLVDPENGEQRSFIRVRVACARNITVWGCRRHAPQLPEYSFVAETIADETPRNPWKHRQLGPRPAHERAAPAVEGPLSAYCGNGYRRGRFSVDQSGTRSRGRRLERADNLINRGSGERLSSGWIELRARVKVRFE